MKKIGITTLASLAVNIILSLWLVNQYFYDQYFHAYVDSALGPVYPFIVLTAGLGGGSSLGYLLLRRRHSDEVGQMERSKLFRSGGQAQGAGTASGQNKIMPTGPPPGQVSRHTAYAVPPLPKSSSSSSGGSRSISSPSGVVGSKTVSTPPSSGPRMEQPTQPSTSILNSTLRDQFRPEQASRPTPSISPPFAPPRPDAAQSINRIPPEPSKGPFPGQWKPEPSAPGDRGPDSTVFPRLGSLDKPGVESSAFGSPPGQTPKPPQVPQTPFPVSKWTPPEQRTESQWTDPVPKPGLAAPQKWSPPLGQGFAQPRPPSSGIPPRPAPGQAPGPPGQRPPFPPSQGGPRPLGFPATPRPGQPGPVGVAPPFRSDQPRPGGLPPLSRPASPPGSPSAQPWSPPKIAETTQEKEAVGSTPRSPGSLSSEGRPLEVRASDASPSGGEMDWDTALDTILKTLKKDRGVGEKT